MARKASANSESSRGFYDIIGIVLMCFAALLLAALLSYHPRDVSANAVPAQSVGPQLDWPVRGLAGLLLLSWRLAPPRLSCPCCCFSWGWVVSSTPSATCAAAGPGRWSF